MEAAESIGAGAEERVEEWALAHEALSKFRLKRAALDAEEGTWLLRAFRAATHVYFGYASFGEYIERLFGLKRRATEEKLRVAGALEALPELAEALRSAKLNWSVVRELSRVAVPETEREWILAACRKTAREVERMVSGLAPGDRPAARRRPESVRHILTFEVGAETLATFREAMKAVQKRSDHRLDDDAALLLMAREVLGGLVTPAAPAHRTESADDARQGKTEPGSAGGARLPCAVVSSALADRALASIAARGPARLFERAATREERPTRCRCCSLPARAPSQPGVTRRCPSLLRPLPGRADAAGLSRVPRPMSGLRDHSWCALRQV